MEICFCSSIFDMNYYDLLQKDSKVPLSLADHNLNSSIIHGLDDNLLRPITLINTIPIPTYPNYPKILIRQQKWSHTEQSEDVHTGYINLPIFKQFSKAITTFTSLGKWIRGHSDKDLVIFVYDAHPYLCIPILLQKKLHPRVKTVIIAPDVPTTVASFVGRGRWKQVHEMYSHLKLWLEKRFDMYILTTKYMVDKLGIGDKPYVVVEGIYGGDKQDQHAVHSEDEKKIIFYSGALREAYGIKNLVEAVCGIDDSAYELWICGAGELASYVEDMAKKTKRVKYYGFVNGEKIAELQQQSTVLVNPRQNSGEYTKYSFPSKTMEYLASGKPVIGYRLDGFPEEYGDYIHYVPDNTVEALRAKIVEICSLNVQTRQNIGSISRKFILEQKTPKAQCGKIVKMLGAENNK
ncbi:glycosyltransferase [Gehongia tenuis]|uniref:Glycosyltransferase n=1 Tax=Gehongia tenuis TaxID=2763655 RepID=A0A926D6M7_9FIRM|nr:glycosyltransferase [Gehongia tenuis]MBC8532359.1 glycosyltransferase [Gehongia tenuis]